MVQVISTRYVEDYFDYSEAADGVIYDDYEKKTKGSTRKSGSRPRASITNTKPELVGTIQPTRKGKSTATVKPPTKPQLTTPILRTKNKRKRVERIDRVEVCKEG